MLVTGMFVKIHVSNVVSTSLLKNNSSRSSLSLPLSFVVSYLISILGLHFLLIYFCLFTLCSVVLYPVISVPSLSTTSIFSHYPFLLFLFCDFLISLSFFPLLSYILLPHFTISFSVMCPLF